MPDAAQQPPSSQTRKILVLIGLENYKDDGSIWVREAGLISQTLRVLGMDSRIMVFGDEEQHSADPDKPLMYVPISSLEDPAWWKAHAPYAVLFMLWGASRYARIRSAALQATPRVIEKLDTDGVKSPRIWFNEYMRMNWVHCMDGNSAMKRRLAPMVSFIRALVVYLFPALLDRKLVTSLAAVPVVAAESPIAVERLKRWSRRLGVPPPRMACIHHPVYESEIYLDPAVRRQNKIIAVGRMQAAQKNLPLMLKVLEEFLPLYPDWSVEIIGRLPDNLEQMLTGMAAESRKRIDFTGPIPHAQLAAHYSSAKIYFLSSRHEGFCNTVSESLCCGCSVVGAVDTAGIPFVTAYASGTVACRQTPSHFLDALCAEVEAWKAGWRDPAAIAKEWSGRVGSKAVAKKVLETFESITS